MKFGLTNVQTHRGHAARHFGAPKRTSPPRYRVRWPMVICVGFCLSFWVVALAGVTLMK